jgi:transposase-like protein
VIVIWVVDVVAARRALRAGLLRCPDCRGALGPWATARARRIRVLGGRQIELAPDRGRCRECRRTHVLLPAQVVPRSGYSVDVIGAALLATARGDSRRTIAAELAIPVGTLRDWRRAARRGATALIAIAAQADAGASIFDGRSTGSRLGSQLTESLDALGAAVKALVRSTPALTGGHPGQASGIDYLASIDAGRHHRLLHRLRLADPGASLEATPPWHLANVIARGQLIATAFGG